MPNIKLKSREETTKVNVVFKNHEGKTWKELQKHSLRAGYLVFPYHYFIDDEGIVYEGRPLEAVPSHDFEPSSINILVDNTYPERINVLQKASLDSVLKTIHDEYPDIPVSYGEAQDNLE